jgi:hypothetical protein
MPKFNDRSRSLVALAEDSTLIAAIWRLLTHQSDCELVKWHRERTADGRGITRMVMIVAMARKLLIALWGVCRQRQGAPRHAAASGGLNRTASATA